MAADTDTAELRAVVADAVAASTGRTLDELTATEAIDVADQLRAIAALPTPSPRDVHLAAELDAAAAIIEGHAGTG